MARLKDRQTSPAVYEHLWAFESGFDQARRALRDLGKHRMFEARELDRFALLLEEARVATASYVTGALEEAETDQAGRLFRLRKSYERRGD